MAAPTMRESIAAAMEKHEEPVDEQELQAGGETGGSTEDTSQSVGDTTETGAGDASDVPTLVDEGESADEIEARAAADTQTGDATSDRPVKGQKREVPGADDPAKGLKAPAGWKPAVKAEWDKLPSSVRMEISRRERETDVALSRSSNARQFSENFMQITQPFDGMLRSMNVTPLQAVRDLMTTAGGLVMGTPVGKAQIVAEIIRNYGVDITHLDSILAGQQVKDDGADPKLTRQLQQQLQPITEFMTNQQRREQEQQQQLQDQADGYVETFGQNVDYFEDLRYDMADIIELANKRGQKITLAQAYNTAALAHPDIAPLVRGKLAAKPQNATNEQRRRAASSLKGGAPNGLGNATPKDLRGAIVAAMDKHAR